MKGVIVHGALLGVMLIYGYRTWTKSEAIKPTTGEVVMWTRGEADLKTIELTSDTKTVRIERRGTGADAYWWGTDSRQTKKPKPPEVPPPAPFDPTTPVDPTKPVDPAAPVDPAKAAVPEMITETVTTEFPVGPEGEKLIKQYARMRALKGIGVPSDEFKKDYGLTESKTSLAVIFTDGAKTFVVGSKVPGGSDRYLQDLDSSKVFVVLSTMVSQLEGGEASLRPTDLRPFDPKTAAQIEIAAAGKTKSVARIKVKPPRTPTPTRRRRRPAMSRWSRPGARARPPTPPPRTSSTSSRSCGRRATTRRPTSPRSRRSRR